MYYSQCGQDEYLHNTVFKGYNNGFYMDVGAHDGVFINNTLYFEKNHDWHGINIEANPNLFMELIKNRPNNNININCAVCNEDGTSEFLCNTGYTDGLSGLTKTYDPRHMSRLNRENRIHKSTTSRIQVITKRIETICDENNIKHINYLSIDVEGAEMEVIASINFDKVFIDVIGFENNYNDKSVEIIEYLKGKSYKVLKHYTDIFMIHQDSQFVTDS
jgi:FkbM family methyltransferase